MAKHFVFESGHQNQIFFSKNRSPSFQESSITYEDPAFDLEKENFYLKQKLKRLEEVSLISNEDYLNRDIQRMKEFQEKQLKLQTELDLIDRKYTKLKRKYENLASENISLQKQLKDSQDSHKKDEFITGTKDLEFFELVSKFRSLEKELESVQKEKKEKLSHCKSKILTLTEEFEQALQEKNNLIEELQERLLEVKRKVPSKSPIKTCRTPRKNSVNHLQEITNTIVSLEKSQAEYKQQYKTLQKTKVASFKEINHLYDILKDNEKRLKQAKKLRENIFKSN